MNIFVMLSKYRSPNRRIKCGKKKRGGNILKGYKLQHDFRMIDNWDGSFCGDFCAGCSSCDHYPPIYALRLNYINVKYVSPYCADCGNKFKDDKKLDNEEKADIVLYFTTSKNNLITTIYDPTKVENTCIDCYKELDEKKMIIERIESISICSTCSNDFPLRKKDRFEKKDLTRVYDTYTCSLCKITYNIITGKHILCTDISKLEEYSRKETFISMDGQTRERTHYTTSLKN